MLICFLARHQTNVVVNNVETTGALINHGLRLNIFGKLGLVKGAKGDIFFSSSS